METMEPQLKLQEADEEIIQELEQQDSSPVMDETKTRSGRVVRKPER